MKQKEWLVGKRIPRPIERQAGIPKGTFKQCGVRIEEGVSRNGTLSEPHRLMHWLADTEPQTSNLTIYRERQTISFVRLSLKALGFA